MTMAIQFDTLRYVEKLISAGIPEAQAKAGAEALSIALSESTSSAFATKDDLYGATKELKNDLTAIKLEMSELKSDIKLLRWVGMTTVACLLSIVVKLFF